ncbi:MAG TPA: hypothetical protein VF755_13620 [Catenuloplanes sp.]
MHRRIEAGRRPAQALHEAQRALRASGDPAAAAAFACFRAGRATHPRSDTAV